MKNHESQDIPENIDINPSRDLPFAPTQSRISIKDHPILAVILLNCCSAFIILFFISGGHPIDKLGQISKAIAYKIIEDDSQVTKPKSIDELFAQDLVVAREVVNSQYGANKFIMMEDITYKKDVLAKHYPIIKNSKGNLLLNANGIFYYLSADTQRLYLCLVDVPPEIFGTKPATISNTPREKKRPELKTDEGRKTGEIYQDKDGVWKNY